MSLSVLHPITRSGVVLCAAFIFLHYCMWGVCLSMCCIYLFICAASILLCPAFILLQYVLRLSCYVLRLSLYLLRLSLYMCFVYLSIYDASICYVLHAFILRCAAFIFLCAAFIFLCAAFVFMIEGQTTTCCYSSPTNSKVMKKVNFEYQWWTCQAKNGLRDFFWDFERWDWSEKILL